MVALAIRGEVTPEAILTKCGIWADMMDVIMCAIFGDCRLRIVDVERWVILPSLIDSLTTLVTLLRDCVILRPI